MKTINRLAFFSIVILAFTIGARAQDDGPIAGGYGDISAKSAEAQSSAKFAVSAWARKSGKKLVLVKVVKAEQQVVAGMNYRLCITIKEAGKTRMATVVVYKNLQNKRSLTNWRTGKCP